LGCVLHVRAFLSFVGRLYICEGAGWAAILGGSLSFVWFEWWLGLESGVALVLELFVILPLIWLGVACNLTS